MAKRGKVAHNVVTKDIIERPIRSRKYDEYFLIVCEDESTEPYYFGEYQKLFDSILPKKTVYLKTVGTGRNSLGVVEQAIEERDRLQNEADTHVDHVWAVFDKDSLDESEGNKLRFEQAFVLAKKEQISVAYSNECFELWLLLHFVDVSPEIPLSRTDDIYPALERVVNKGRTEATEIPYDHKHPDAVFIDAIKKAGLQENAIQRATKLDQYHNKLNHSPIDSNPNTLVYKLVSLLNGLLDWYKNC